MKKNNGITLIALTVTIIVLLVVSGVTIAILNGDNGMINHGFNSKKQTEFARAKEELINEWYKVEFDHADDNVAFEEKREDLLNKLKQYDEDALVIYYEESNTMRVNYKSYIFELTPKGEVTEIDE